MTTLAQYLEDSSAQPGVAQTVLALGEAALVISDLLRYRGMASVSPTGINVQGETQKPMDVFSNNEIIERLAAVPHVAFAVSEEVEDVIALNGQGTLGVLFDPLDGSSNIDTCLSVGTIASIVPALNGQYGPIEGTQQLAALYFIYGPSTQMVLTLNGDVAIFMLEKTGSFTLVQCGLKIPGNGAEYAVNTSRRHYWDAPFLKAVEHLELGKEGFFGRQLSMRWTGSMVADVHRVLTRGGLFMYPVDSGNEVSGGRLRLLYEGLPIALIIENAGGLATDGRKRLLEIDVTHPHQRVGLIFGSRLDALNFAVLVQQP